MDIVNKNGVKVSVSEEKFFEIVRGLPEEKQAALMFNILEYDNGGILKAFAKKKYADCVKNTKKFIEISKDEVICKKLGVDEFDEGISNSYLGVANRYKAEGEIWKQFLK